MVTTMKQETRIKVFRGENGFAAAHFLFNMGKCERLHGHNYSVTVEVCGHCGPDGAIIDFHELSPVIKGICETLDHCVIIAGRDDRYNLSVGDKEVEVKFKSKRFVFPRNECVILPIIATTVEKLAEFILDTLLEQLTGSYPDMEWIEVGVREGAAQMALCRRHLD